MPPFPGFVGGSSSGQSLTFESERAVNVYVERAVSEASANRAALLPTPGFQQWSTQAVADVGGRGLAYANGHFYGVLGQGFYEWDINGTPTKRGTVAVDEKPAQIIFNGVVANQIGIASAGNFYWFNPLTPGTPPVQVLAGEATQIAYAGGFGFAFNLATGKVRLSNLNDFSTWSGSQFFQRSLFADPWQAMFVDANNLLWLVGTDTFEVWYNTGVGTQPFAPLSGLVGRYGIAAPFAFGPFGQGNFWLARNPEGIGEFVVTHSNTPQAVSTFPVNAAIDVYLRSARIDDAEALLYQQAGHTFANVTFPAAQHTWSYDVTVGLWAERGRWNAMRGDYDIWSPRCHALAFGKHLIGDRTTGLIWQMDPAFATELDGTGIRRLRRSPHLNEEHKRVPIDHFELLMDVAPGAIQVGQGSDPKAMLRVSEDGGRFHWSNERQASVGKIGQSRARRVYWPRCGASPDAVFEVSYSEPTPFRVVNAWVNNAA